MRIAYLALIELDVPNACLIHTREIAENMALLGHEVDLFLPKPLQPISRWAGIKHHWVRFWGFDELRRFFFMVECCLRLIRQHYRKKFDILYMRELADPLLIVHCCRWLKLPYFVELNGWALDELAMSNPAGEALERMEKRQQLLFGNATGIISSTQGNAANVIRHYGVPEDRVTVQELGVNGDMFGKLGKREAREALHLDMDARYLLFAGSFHPHHDLSTLIRSLAIAKLAIPDLQLLLVGDGAERVRSEQWVQEEGLQASVHFMGAHPYEQMPTWFAAADIFMIPLLKRRIALQNGCFVTKLWEALAAKVPVIITDLPQTSSYGVLEDKAWIVPPEDAAAMAAAVQALLCSPSTIEISRIERAYHYVLQERSWRREAQQTIDFITQKLYV